MLRRLCWSALLCCSACFAKEDPAYQQWVGFKKDLNEEASGPIGMYAIQDMQEVAAGEAAYLPAGKNVRALRWAKAATPDAIAKVEYKEGRAILSGPGLQTTDLLQAAPQRWVTLPNGLNVRATVRGKVLKAWLYNPALIAQKKFKGLDFFPYAEEGLVEASFRRNDIPVAVSYLDSRETSGTMYDVGTLQMQLGGKQYDLKTFSYKKSWDEIDAPLLLLKDRTSGRTTYGGGRVVDIHIPKGSPPPTLKVNLNTAYSFLCAHSEFYNCPLVLTNRIDTELSYGERYPPRTE